MTPPTVSVLTTAFNRECCVGAAIESVLSSSFGDLELIVVDDCSTDGTVEVARRYLSDPRVQVHRNERQLGDYPNRNRAASLARGKYLKYVDSDDLIYPHGLEVMIRALERFPDAAFGVPSPPLPDRPHPVRLSPQEAYREHYLQGGLLYIAATSALVRRQAFEQAGGFSGKRHVGDTELWLKLAAQAPVVKLMPGLVWLRRDGSPDQECMIGEATSVRVSLIYGVDREALLDPSCPLSPEEHAVALARLEHRQARRVLHLGLRQRRLAAALRVMRETGVSPGALVQAGFRA